MNSLILNYPYLSFQTIKNFLLRKFLNFFNIFKIFSKLKAKGQVYTSMEKYFVSFKMIYSKQARNRHKIEFYLKVLVSKFQIQSFH